MAELKILKTTVDIGLGHEVKFLHLTDTHIALDDEGDERGRFQYFSHAEDYFHQTCAYAKENGLVMLNTGDLLDAHTQSNFDFADKYLLPTDTIYAAGNHDFCHFVGKATEDYAYKWDRIKYSAPHLPNNLYFYSRVIDGVNFVTLDDSYYLMTDGQIEMLKAEAARGYPIVLGIHIPLFTRAQADQILANGNKCAYLTGAPREYTDKYPPDRSRQQVPDEATLRAIEYIQNEPMIKLIVTGHTHINFEDTLPGGTLQITTDGGYHGYAREITLI
jgi:predicted phosphodiesterase